LLGDDLNVWAGEQRGSATMDGIAGPSNIVGLIDAAKSGSPVPNLEIRANWQTRWFDPTTSSLLLVMWLFDLHHPGPVWLWLYWPTLPIIILGLVLEPDIFRFAHIPSYESSFRILWG